MKKERRISILVILLISVMTLQGISVAPVKVFAASDSTTTSIFDPDYAELIGRSDLSHTGTLGSGVDGFTVSNGRLGGPVWQTAANSTLTMQVNHTDVAMYGDSSSRSGANGGGIGRVHIGFGADNVFGSTTQQRLNLYDGRLNIVSGTGVEVNVVPNMDSDAIAIQITDHRATPQPITIDLRSLRPGSQTNGSGTYMHSASSAVTAENSNAMIVLDQIIQEKCDTGITENDFYNHAALAVSVQGRTPSGNIENNPGSGGNARVGRILTVPAEKGTFTVIIGGDASLKESMDVKGKAIANAKDSPSYEELSARSKAWWNDFWQASYVYLPSLQHFEQRRNYYLYLMAISSRGNYPQRYNGGMWLGEEDRRDWGPFYWNWNQDSVYQAVIDANHLELMDSNFKMREELFDKYKIAAQQMWGANDDSIYIGETSGLQGWEILPNDVAAGVRDYYTFSDSTKSPVFTTHANKRNQYLPAWNYRFSDIGQAGYVTHGLVCTQETAEYFWQRYCITKDLDFLRDQGYKFLKGAAELYRSWFGFTKDSSGKYHINKTHLHEHIWAGTDVIDDLSLAKGVFPAAAKAAELLGVDPQLQEIWKDIAENLAPYPLRSDSGAIWADTTASAGLKTYLNTNSEPAFAQGKSPRSHVRDTNGTESPILKMLEKYDVLNLETRDQGLDNGDWEKAMTTYIYSPGYYNQVLGTSVDRNGSSRFHIDAAKLGRGDDLGKILNTQYGVFTTYGIRSNMLFDQLDYYSAEGYGTFATALQSGLNQSLAPTSDGDSVIRVFPAWPKAWDAKYKLAAKDGFLVSSSMVQEEVQYVEIESQLGETCRVRNPWDSDVVLYRNGVKAETINVSFNDLMEFETAEGEIIVLVKQGTTPDDYRTPEITTSDHFVVNDAESNIVYTGDWTYSDNRSDRKDYQNDVHVTNTNSDAAEYTFTGNCIEFITETGPDMGEVEVYIDGKLEAIVDCYSPTKISYQEPVHSRAGLKYEYVHSTNESYQGRHTIKLVKKSGKVMMLDAFKISAVMGGPVYDVNQTNEEEIYINNNDSRVIYTNISGSTTVGTASNASGDWFSVTNRSGEGAYQGTAHISGNGGSAGDGNFCELTFTGTGVSYRTERNNDMGDVHVYLDGEDKGTVSCYTAGARDAQYEVFAATDLPSGEHTLKLVKEGGEYMVVDHFRVTVPAELSDVKGIKLTRQPGLVYDAGHELDLSALRLTVTFENDVEKILKYNDPGIAASITDGAQVSHGSVLETEHNGKTLTVSYGSKSVVTEPLQVGFISVLIDDTDSRITYTGTGTTWRAVTNKDEGGTYKGTANIVGGDGGVGNGSYCELTFNGIGVSYLTERNDDMGKVDVYVDGILMAVVDCYKTDGKDARYSIYTILGLPDGEHTLKLVKASGDYMVVDCFKVWLATYKTYEELQVLIDGAADLKEADYTLDSWAVLANARGNAQAILSDAQVDIITATYNALQKAIDGLVEQTIISVTGVILDQSTLVLKVGEKRTLTAIIAPEDASNTDVEWSSSHPSTATVKNGEVTAVAAGSATITVKTKDGSFTATCKVTVTESAKVDISKASLRKIASQVFTGKAITPGIQLTYNGKTLAKDKDYTISYSKNVNIGTAKVIIRGKGSYQGLKNTSFAIVMKKGKPYTVGNYKYKVTNAKTNGKGTVTVTDVKTKSLKSITVKGTVKIGGKTFKITVIGSAAFKNCTKAKKVTIGKNVKVIQANAFNNCKNLKDITIKSNVLGKIGKQALKGIAKNAKIIVPKKKLTTYTNRLKNKGQSNTVKIRR